MLERIMRELPRLTAAVVGADVKGDPSYDVTKTGAADAARATGKAAAKTARKTGAKAKRSTRQARKVPGVAQAEGQVKGAVASQSDLAIAGYDTLTAEEIVAKLPSSRRSSSRRSTPTSATTRTARRSSTASARSAATSRGRATTSSPSPRSETALGEADDDRLKAVRTYERAHKARAGVLKATSASSPTPERLGPAREASASRAAVRNPTGRHVSTVAVSD